METIMGRAMLMSSLPTGMTPILFSFNVLLIAFSFIGSHILTFYIISLSLPIASPIFLQFPF